MPCYFLRDGHVAGVEMLPFGLSDEGAIARTRTLCSKRKGPLNGLELWDHGRMVFRHPIRTPRLLTRMNRMCQRQ